MPAEYSPETVTLRDGTTVTIRAIRPDDPPRLQALFGRLSAESIYLRFLEQRRSLSDREAERLVTVDYHQQMAIVATREDELLGEELVIGVARYAAIDSPARDSAEAAIVVEDRYQNLGLGTLLLDRLLAYARAQGIAAFLADINPDNERMLHFIRRSGLPASSKLAEGALEIRIGIN